MAAPTPSSSDIPHHGGAEHPPHARDGRAPLSVTRGVRQGERFTRPADVTLHIADFDFASHAVEAATQLAAHSATRPLTEMPSADRDHDDATAWERHYQRHSSKFFPIKNYLFAAFPELTGHAEEGTDVCSASAHNDVPSKRRRLDGGVGAYSEPAPENTSNVRPVLLECGCGTGSALLPLVSAGFPADYYAFDISPTAVTQLQAHMLLQGDSRPAVTAFTWDMRPPVPPAVEGVQFDFIMLLFVLSAVPPADMAAVVRTLGSLLKPGGAILFRDYGAYDHAQMRFHEKHPEGVEAHGDGRVAYRRGDGTQSYFFSTDEVARLAASAGLRPIRNEYHCVENINRKNKQRMRKVFATAVLQAAST